MCGWPKGLVIPWMSRKLSWKRKSRITWKFMGNWCSSHCKLHTMHSIINYNNDQLRNNANYEWCELLNPMVAFGSYDLWKVSESEHFSLFLFQIPLKCRCCSIKTHLTFFVKLKFQFEHKLTILGGFALKNINLRQLGRLKEHYYITVVKCSKKRDRGGNKSIKNNF